MHVPTIGPISIGIVLGFGIFIFGCWRILHTLRKRDQINTVIDGLIWLADVEESLRRYECRRPALFSGDDLPKRC